MTCASQYRKQIQLTGSWGAGAVSGGEEGDAVSALVRLPDAGKRRVEHGLVFELRV